MTKLSSSARRIALSPRPQRRTLSAHADAEARVAQDLARLAAAIDGELSGSLSALVLLGAYARGEGSVVERDGEIAAASSYELLAILRSESVAQRSLLERSSASWSARLDVQVRLHARARKQLGCTRASLTWVDVAAGRCELLAGDPEALAELPVLQPQDLPPESAAFLTLDAALGLAWSNLSASSTRELEARRAHHAVLLCGDALLLRASHYTADLQQRCTELARIEVAYGYEGLAGMYEDAARYQERPDRWRAPGTQAQWYDGVRACVARTHLRLESSRVGAAIDPLGYALFSGKLWPDTRLLPFVALRSALHAARAGDAHNVTYLGDPRERLARCAALLGYAHERPEARRLAARLLGVHSGETRAPTDGELLAQLTRLGRRVAERQGDPLFGARYGRD